MPYVLFKSNLENSYWSWKFFVFHHPVMTGDKFRHKPRKYITINIYIEACFLAVDKIQWQIYILSIIVGVCLYKIYNNLQNYLSHCHICLLHSYFLLWGCYRKSVLEEQNSASSSVVNQLCDFKKSLNFSNLSLLLDYTWISFSIKILCDYYLVIIIW